VFVIGADGLVVSGREFWNQDDLEDSKQRERGLKVVGWEKGGKEGVGGGDFVNSLLGMGIISREWCHGNFAPKDVEFNFVFGNKEVGKMGDKFHIGHANENGRELFLDIRESGRVIGDAEAKKFVELAEVGKVVPLFAL
jgi:hypothetical protein